VLNLEILGSLASRLHLEFREMFYVLLPIFFMVALAIGWFRTPSGGSDFVETLKRVIVASLLLAGFQEITDAILLITTAVVQRIDDMNGLESYIRMISEKASTIPMSPFGAILALDDFIMSVLTYLSYFLVYLARVLMLSIYHFTWIFFVILSPIILLFHVFSPKITVGLFKSLIEVASWPIVWAVLSVMLKSLPYGRSAAADSGYLTLIVLNFVIAIALVLTPFLVKGIVGSAFTAVASSLVPITASIMRSTPAAALPMARYVATGTVGGSSTAGSSLRNAAPRAPTQLKPGGPQWASPASQISPNGVSSGPPPWQSPPKSPKPSNERDEN
jgi:hypothetical protein